MVRISNWNAAKILVASSAPENGNGKVGFIATCKHVKEAKRLIKGDSPEGESFRKLLVTCAKLQGLDAASGKRAITYQKEVLQDAKMLLASQQKARDIVCDDFQKKLELCHDEINEIDGKYDDALSELHNRLAEELKQFKEIIHQETDPQKREEFSKKYKEAEKRLEDMDSESSAWGNNFNVQGELVSVGDAIGRLRKAMSNEELQNSLDFKQVSDFFDNIDNNMERLKREAEQKTSNDWEKKKERINSAINGLKTLRDQPPESRPASEFPQPESSNTAQANQTAVSADMTPKQTSKEELLLQAQTKLDQLKAKQEECNKNFDEIFANHESTLKAFEVLAEGDTNFQDVLKRARENLQQYKADYSGLDYSEAIEDFSKKLEQLKSGDSESVQDIAELSKQIDRHIKSMGQVLSFVKNRMPSLSGLQGSAYSASSRQINAFNKAIKADMEKATAISTQHAQMTDCFKGAMDKLPASMQLPDNIQTLYNDFAQASKNLQTGIQEISQQAKSVADDFYYGAWNKFRTADIASNPGVIEQFAEARKIFKSNSERVKNDSKNIETLQQACTDKLSALEAELLKTPTGCQVLMDAHKAQMDQSISAFEKAVELAENKSNYTLTWGSCSPSNRPKVEALCEYAQQRKGASAPIKQSIDQAHSTNVTNLNTNNEDFLKSYEAFDQVYQKGKKELDEMFQGLESQYNSTGFDDENWQAFLIKARGLPSEES